MVQNLNHILGILMWGFCLLHATGLDNNLIRRDIHSSPYKMYHGEMPTWIPFLKSFGELAILKTSNKLQAKFRNRGLPGKYLGPVENHKGDTFNFCNPITKRVVESRSKVFLQQTHSSFHKLDKSQFDKQVASITEDLKGIFYIDEDVTPVDDEGFNLPN
jgi:hypothetical protein